MTLIALAATMTVNTLVTGLIVIKILKVFFEVERTLGSSSSAAGRPNYQRIAFIIIESGMALFTTHLIRIMISILLEANPSHSSGILLAFALVVAFHQMLNVIIRSFHFYSFVLLITVKFTWLGHRTNNNFGAGLNGIVLRWRRVLQGRCRKS